MATIVLCSYVIRYPVGGVLSSNLQLLGGLARLGHEVYLFEQAGYPDSCFDPRRRTIGEDPAFGCAAVDRMLTDHGLGGRWCYVDHRGDHWGMDRARVRAVFAAADVYIDRGLHGVWDDEAADVPVRVLLDPDPGHRQVRMQEARAQGATFDAYDRFFTYGFHIGTPRSPAPDAGVTWEHVFHPVDTASVAPTPPPRDGAFSTVMNWRSLPPVRHRGVEYGMKDVEFASFEELPRLVRAPLDLAIEGGAMHRRRLEQLGWRLRSALEETRSLAAYHDLIRRSLGEFSVAKQVYVGLNTGWFSDRSAAYLAHGRPVVVQDNGLSGVLPLGEGLHAVSTVEAAAAAIDAVLADPVGQGRAAREIAEEHLSAERVLGRFVESLGTTRAAPVASGTEPVVRMGARRS